jgi:hypothetical protein
MDELDYVKVEACFQWAWNFLNIHVAKEATILFSIEHHVCCLKPPFCYLYKNKTKVTQLIPFTMWKVVYVANKVE